MQFKNSTIKVLLKKYRTGFLFSKSELFESRTLKRPAKKSFIETKIYDLQNTSYLIHLPFD